MKPIDVTVRDDRREWRREVPRDVGILLLASLSADPMSLDDLRWACLRFMPPEMAEELFRPHLEARDRPALGRSDATIPAVALSQTTAPAGGDPSPADRMVIDLARRRLFASWDPRREAASVILPGSAPPDRCCYFHLHDEWKVSSDLSILDADSSTQAIPCLRLRQPEVRERLYGEPLLEFLVEQSTTEALVRDGWSGVAFTTDPPEREALCTMVRLVRLRMGRWLQGPSGGDVRETVRDWLLRDCFHIERDLRDRTCQWQRSGQMPPGISLDSETAQRMGAGRHEVILYFELLHHLTVESLLLATSESPNLASRYWANEQCLSTEELLRELRASRDAWLDSPADEVTRRSPRQLILLERQRTPILVSRRERQENCDCPLCVLIASQCPEWECFRLDDDLLTDEFPRFWVGGKTDFLRQPSDGQETMFGYPCPFGGGDEGGDSHADGEFFSRRPDPNAFAFRGEPLQQEDDWAHEWTDGWVDDWGEKEEWPREGARGPEAGEGDAVDEGAGDASRRSRADEEFDEEWLGVASRFGGKGPSIGLGTPQADAGLDPGRSPHGSEQIRAAMLLGPWRGVYFEKPQEKPSQDFLVLRFAACLTELVSDLHSTAMPSTAPTPARQLTGLFQNLLDALANDRTGVAAVVSRFCGTLDDLPQSQPETAAKVTDLQEQLLDLLMLTQP